MTSDRRQFLKVAASAAALATGGAHVALVATGEVIAITSGIATDTAFVRGAAAAMLPVDTRSHHAFETLVKSLTDLRGQRVIALVEPRFALLLEEAAMDCGLAMSVRSAVRIPKTAAAQSIAHDIGRALAIGVAEPASLAPLSRGITLIALVLHGIHWRFPDA